MNYESQPYFVDLSVLLNSLCWTVREVRLEKMSQPYFEFFRWVLRDFCVRLTHFFYRHFPDSHFLSPHLLPYVVDRDVVSRRRRMTVALIFSSLASQAQLYLTFLQP